MTHVAAYRRGRQIANISRAPPGLVALHTVGDRGCGCCRRAESRAGRRDRRAHDATTYVALQRQVHWLLEQWKELLGKICSSVRTSAPGRSRRHPGYRAGGRRTLGTAYRYTRPGYVIGIVRHALLCILATVTVDRKSVV